MNQQFNQFYNVQPAAMQNSMSPEQLAMLQKQQQAFLQQQQQYFLQQQEMQKQCLREEQRNRLRNMNVKSMGAPTFRQSTNPPNSYSNTSAPDCFAGNSFNHTNVPTAQHLHLSPNAPTINEHLNVPRNNASTLVPQMHTDPQLMSYSYNQFAQPQMASANPNTPHIGGEAFLDAPSTNNQQLVGSIDSFGSLSATINNSRPDKMPVQGWDNLFSGPNQVGTNSVSDEDDQFGEFTSTVSNTSSIQAGGGSVMVIPSASSFFSEPSDTQLVSLGAPFADNGLLTDIQGLQVEQRPNTDSTVSESFGSFAAQVDTVSNNTISNTDTSFDDFDDFKSATIESTPIQITQPAQNNCYMPSPAADYVPGTLTNENEDVIHSVEIFSNPIKVENSTTNRTSEFDKLIEKSLSGKVSKSDTKSLFRPVSKTSTPTSKLNIAQSSQSADWKALDVADLFQLPVDDKDEFSDFCTTSAAAGNSAVQHDLLNTISAPSVSAVSDITNDLMSVFGSTSVHDTKSMHNPFQSAENSQTNAVTSSKSASTVFDIFTSSTTVPEAPIFDIFGDSAGPSITVKPIVSTNNDWCNAMPVFNISGPKKITTAPPLIPSFSPKSRRDIDVSKLPAIYRGIIDFCNTESGIIDVGKVYEAMLTDQFNIVVLQPLMGQCNMSESPGIKDLVDLIGIASMRQKGIPTPSKYELNYDDLPLPATVNKAILNLKVEQTNGPTLLSVVTSEAKKQGSSKLKPVFDFGLSANVDLSSAPFASKDVSNDIFDFNSVDDGDDDWGNFGSFESSTKSSEYSTQIHGKIVTKEQATIYGDQIPKIGFTSLDLVKPKSHTSKFPPQALDEPPPLSDNDDDDWADFTHPAHKWDIDHSEIEEAALDNIATKNRWGNTAAPHKKHLDDSADKDFSHVDIKIEQSDQSANFFDAKINLPPITLSESFTSTDNNHGKDCADNLGSTENEVTAITEEHFSAVQPNFDETKPKMDTSESGVANNHNMDRLASCDDISDPISVTTPVNQENSFISPFADFGDFNNNDNLVDEFDDFSEYQGDSTTNTEVTESKSSQPGELDEPDDAPLTLKNLPVKDLDGFWNDMVDSLGPKVEVKQQTDVDIAAFAPEFDYFPNAATVLEPVSYDALKAESCSPKEEDRLGTWSKCLSLILTLLIQCHDIFSSPDTSVPIIEVVASEKAQVYLRCCTEIFKVACRISVSGASEDGVVEIFKEIKHTWTLISETLDETYDLPTIRDFNVHHLSDDSIQSHRNCGICLLDTGSESKSNKLVYNGVFYHVTCANFWLNTINPTLPNLNSKLRVPLL